LNQDSSSARLLVGFEQMDRLETEAVNPSSSQPSTPIIRPGSNTLAQAAHVSGGHPPLAACAGDRANIDTNREHLRSHDTAKGCQHRVQLLRSGQRIK